MLQEPQNNSLQQLQSYYQEWKTKLNNKIHEISSSGTPNRRLAAEYQHLIETTEAAWRDIIRDSHQSIQRISTAIASGNAESAPYFYQNFIPLLSQNSQVSHIIIQSPIFDSLKNKPTSVRAIIQNSRFLQMNLNYFDPVTDMNIADFLLPSVSGDLHEQGNFLIFTCVLKASKNVNHLVGGDTALSIVVRQNIPSVVVKLFERGADIKIPKVNLGLELMSNFYKHTAMVGMYGDNLKESDDLWITGSLYTIAMDQNQQDVIVRLQAANKVHLSPREDGYCINADNALKILNMLSCRGYDMHLFEGDKTSTFMLACALRYESIPNNWMVEQIISQQGFNPNFTSLLGTPYPFMAVANSDIIKNILNLPSIDLKLKDAKGYGVLHAAISFIQEGDLNVIIDILIAKGVSVNTRSLDGSTPFFHACSLSKANVARYLLEKNADASMGLYNGILASHIAAANGDIEIIKLLHEYGAFVNSEVSLLNPSTPLSLASDGNLSEVVNLINEILAGGNASHSLEEEVSGITGLLGDVNLGEHLGENG